MCVCILSNNCCNIAQTHVWGHLNHRLLKLLKGKSFKHVTSQHGNIDSRPTFDCLRKHNYSLSNDSRQVNYLCFTKDKQCPINLDIGSNLKPTVRNFKPSVQYITNYIWDCSFVASLVSLLYSDSV